MDLLIEIFGIGKKNDDPEARKARVAKALAMQKKYKEVDKGIATTKSTDPYNNTPLRGKKKGERFSHTDEVQWRSGMKKKAANESENIEEKAVSRDQQKLMGMVHAYKKGDLKNPSPKVKEIAKGMSDKEAKKFAKTKHRDLPKKVDESPKMVSFKDFLINQ